MKSMKKKVTVLSITSFETIFFNLRMKKVSPIYAATWWLFGFISGFALIQAKNQICLLFLRQLIFFGSKLIFSYFFVFPLRSTLGIRTKLWRTLSLALYIWGRARVVRKLCVKHTPERVPTWNRPCVTARLTHSDAS